MLASQVLIAIAGCSAVLTLAVVIYRKRVNRKRRLADLPLEAKKLGLQITDAPDGEVFRQFDNFKLFAVGDRRRIKNLIVADREDVKISIFDYHYRIASGRHARTQNQTVVAIQSQQLRCPEIMMRPEEWGDKIDAALGFQTRGYDLHREMSKIFILNGPDEAAIRSFFTPEVLEFFEHYPNISVEALGDTMFFYRARKLCEPDELKNLLAQANETFDVLKKANA